jgi:hypothetical protein
MGATATFDLLQMTPLTDTPRYFVIPVLKEELSKLKPRVVTAKRTIFFF